jgi:hypothetical protein
MKCMFALTYLYDLLTYLAAIRAKVVMFYIKPKLMKCTLPEIPKLGHSRSAASPIV